MRARLNVSAGSGAVAGATLPLTVQLPQTWFRRANGQQHHATSDRDFVGLQALSIVAVHLSQWAEEMILFSTQGTDSSRYGRIRPVQACRKEECRPPRTDPRRWARTRRATTLLVTVKGLSSPTRTCRDARALVRCGADGNFDSSANNRVDEGSGLTRPMQAAQGGFMK
jgi:hypothetical protein